MAAYAVLEQAAHNGRIHARNQWVGREYVVLERAAQNGRIHAGNQWVGSEYVVPGSVSIGHGERYRPHGCGEGGGS
jgi:hypothetical protein